jgi:hypothetical protein
MVVRGPWPGITTVAVGQREQLLVDRADEHGAVAARKVGPADRAGKEGVASEQQVHLGRQVQADAALRVAGGVQDVAGQARDRDDAAVFEGVVGRWTSGVGMPSQPACTPIIFTSGRSRWL